MFHLNFFLLPSTEGGEFSGLSDSFLSPITEMERGNKSTSGQARDGHWWVKDIFEDEDTFSHTKMLVMRVWINTNYIWCRHLDARSQWKRCDLSAKPGSVFSPKWTLNAFSFLSFFFSFASFRSEADLLSTSSFMFPSCRDGELCLRGQGKHWRPCTMKRIGLEQNASLTSLVS